MHALQTFVERVAQLSDDERFAHRRVIIYDTVGDMIDVALFQSAECAELIFLQPDSHLAPTTEGDVVAWLSFLRRSNKDGASALGKEQEMDGVEQGEVACEGREHRWRAQGKAEEEEEEEEEEEMVEEEELGAAHVAVAPWVLDVAYDLGLTMETSTGGYVGQGLNTAGTVLRLEFLVSLANADEQDRNMDVEAADEREDAWNVELEVVDEQEDKRGTQDAAMELEEELKAVEVKVKPKSANVESVHCGLTPDEEARVRSALGPGCASERLRVLDNIPVTRRDLRTLRPGQWVNDEVINFFLKMLTQRTELEPAQSQTYIASTLLYAKLTTNGYDFSRVKRWTRGWASHPKRVIVPLHIHGDHWVAAFIDLEHRTFEYYDSLVGDDGQSIYANLMRWLGDVGAVSPEEKAQFHFHQTVEPTQYNFFDCAVFAMWFAFCRATQTDIWYTQDDMQRLRKRVVLEILNSPNGP